ncbi:MAG: potassium transporter TrkA [Chloroflexi bacterium RBG_13_66_10]|jgi:trk system potassium uptake protein TrkA|nr:MAG: potassium transporter TrkA [Chloroflexi bacterium RBG_13_66_10]
MRVIIMGCGRVGEQVSRRLDEKGHQVVVIDADETVRDRLGPKFRGQVVVGVGFDREVLLRAGIEHADAFAAASSSDNANIIAARIARNIYHVPRVVTRLFDPRRAEIYQRLGLVTISSTTWGAERTYQLIAHPDLDTVQSFGHGEVSLIEIEAPPRLVGRMVNQVSVPGEISVVAITREGEAQIPTLGSEFHEGDRIHFAVHARAMSRFEMLLGLGEGA